MVDSIVAATASSANATDSDIAKAKLAEDLDSFLTLLVTQLKNQDPLDPMDANEFTSQLVEFAQVEQQIQQNANLEEILQAQQLSNLGSVVSYIGKYAEVISDQMPLENGASKMSYTLFDNASQTQVTVRNESGTVVHYEQGETSAGTHYMEWDGIDGQGVQHPDGIYQITVSATGPDEVPIEVGYTTFGQVQGVRTDNGDAYLELSNGHFVSLDGVLSVAEPPGGDEDLVN
ncbi:flagellar hook assembly protein FlgD [Magnetospira sp. QH-2]|uniref:flagellar hook assembly protein FlgD n=1 Tax=Magnetospira sp. (strain QH-2) TaxID=1288970 RepID=UPI0003E80AAB|nr:flagellar hook capping FlgD N-terminal domain-containing protein [Magnetospira sp. QH-2]CCQ73053.1 putative flagellar hook assembly protein flgD [Magnetospira sp. QH-2]